MTSRAKRTPLSLLSLALAATLSLFSLDVLAQEETSETNQQLKAALARFPAADTDADGVLTMTEAQAYRDKMTAKGKQGARAKQAPQKKAPAAERGVAPTMENVAYGTHERNVLDLWQAKSDKPTPIVVFIHGGGFVNGDKSTVRGSAALKKFLDHGVSVASINYRFKEHASVPDILRDAARAIQYIRSRAKEWNLDPARVAAYGGSAGAGTSLWLAFHDDLADPNATDPVLRESSRLSVAGSLNGQASYDLRDWAGIMGPAPADANRGESEILGFYRFASMSELETPEADAVMKDCSMMNLVSKDDPPVFAACYIEDTDPENRGQYVHHPRHSKIIAQRCEENGIDCRLVLRDVNQGDRAKAEDMMVDFFLKKLGQE